MSTYDPRFEMHGICNEMMHALVNVHNKASLSQHGTTTVTSTWLDSVIKRLETLQHAANTAIADYQAIGHSKGFADGKKAGYTEGYDHGYEDCKDDLTPCWDGD